MQAVSFKHFLRVWNNTHPNIKLRKFSRFTKCTTCIGLKEKINSTLDNNRRLRYKKQYKIHIDFVKKQRLFYYNKRNSAKNNKDCLSIIIDGSDMANYGIPYFFDITKDSSSGLKIPMKLYGAIVHGINTFAYVLNKNWGGDSNTIVNIIHHIINVLRRDELKKTLYLQVIY